MIRPVRLAIAIGIMLTALVAPVATGTANASLNTSNYWSNNSLVGGCGGEQSGGYVALAQQFLNDYGFGDTRGHNMYVTIDDYWGTQTLNAAKNFQSTNNLTVDGCIGSKTWSYMQPYTAWDATWSSNACGSGTTDDYIFNGNKGFGGGDGGIYEKWHTNGDNLFITPNNQVASPVQYTKTYYFNDPLQHC